MKLVRYVIVAFLGFCSLVNSLNMIKVGRGLPLVKPCTMTARNDKFDPQRIFKTALVSVIAATTLAGKVLSAENAPVAAPLPSVPQVTLAAPRPVQASTSEKWIYSKFLDEVENDRVEKITFSPEGKTAAGVNSDGDRFRVDIPNDPNLLSFLVQHKVEINVAPINNNGALGADVNTVIVPQDSFERALQTFALPGLLTSLIFLVPALKLLFPSKADLENAAKKKKTGGKGRGGLFGGGGPSGMPSRGRGPGGLDPEQFAKSRAKVDLSPVTNTSFSDVAGCDSAKLELEEIVDFLKNPDRYTEMGAKIPKGCLLNGPPGTGKTLLARAVAGEAGVPFISCAGSEFVQIFVGVGAARVRDLFRQARENAPCIIFIDEIDAIGRARGSGSSNDEREQTLNQLLIEMDGFDENSGVITLAATNRIDVLDEALVRPGRFDRKIELGMPDYKGRIEILKVHARNKPLAPDVDLEQVARRTPGLAGSSLKNLLNEAAIHAARTAKDIIDWDDVDWAIDRVTVGIEKSNKDALVEDLELVAFHEAGHAIVGGLMPEYDTVTKISIVPRASGAGGLTFFSPLEDRLDNVVTWHYLESQLAVAWGGRVAEELVFGPNRVTTGASGDLEQIFRICRAMVCELGFSRLPPLNYDFRSRGEEDVDWPLSGWLKERINTEILRLASNGYYTAKKILMANEDLLWELARRLVQDDSVSQEEFHFMLYEYKAKMHPYSMYGDTKVDEMPYQSDPESLAQDLFSLIPRFSTLMPSAAQLSDPQAISALPALREKYLADDAAALERMRRPNPLLQEDWGKSKMEIVEEAKKAQSEESRRARLATLLEEYRKEEQVVLARKRAEQEREKIIAKVLDESVM